jgi:uncharacterized membrane protein YhaH (DUF805 family)
MPLWQAVGHFWSRFFDFRGQTSRAEFWWVMVFLFASWLIVLGIDVFFHVNDIELSVPVMTSFVATTVWALVVALPTLSVVWRRLHDAGHSGWWSVAPVVTAVLAVLLTENTSGESWVPFTTVFFAIATLVLVAMLLVFFLQRTRYAKRPLLGSLGISVVVSFVLTVGAFPALTTEGVVDYNRVSTALGLGALWERTFPTTCGEFDSVVTKWGDWQEPTRQLSGWGRVDLLTDNTPPDRLACVQHHADDDKRRGFLFQRSDEATWEALREDLLAEGFTEAVVWGRQGLSRIRNYPGEPGWSETDIVFYGDAGSLLYTWTDQSFWLRDSYRALLPYVGGSLDTETDDTDNVYPGWRIGDVGRLSCSDFEQLLAQRTGFSVLSDTRDDEGRRPGAPQKDEEPGDYLLCRHTSPNDLHSGREFRVQYAPDTDSQFRLLIDDGFEELHLGQFRGLFREQTVEPGDDSHGSWVDEVYLFATDGWLYFATIDGVILVNDPYFDIPDHITALREQN